MAAVAAPTAAASTGTKSSIVAGLAVIDEERVRRCLWKLEHDYEGPLPDDHGELTQKNDVAFEDIKELRMSYESIGEIRNLEGFTSLHTLALDNNCITKIQNLECLPNLVWLDLSFNKITKIEGLETLAKLEDLSLCNNDIEVIEGLDLCLALNALSLGNNKIKELEQVGCLRKLPKLNVLNLDGNPLCTLDYKNYSVAYLKHLKYLDYSLITSDQKEKAEDSYKDELVELVEKENLEQRAEEFERNQEEKMRDVKAANLLNVDKLLVDMLKDDTEQSKLQLLPFYNKHLEEYTELHVNRLEKFKADMLTLHFEMEAETTAIKEALEEMRAEDTETAIEYTNDFLMVRKNALDKVESMQDVGSQRDELNNLRAKLKESNNDLMQHEITGLDSFGEMMKSFEITYGAMKGKVINTRQEFFREIEELEQTFTEKIREEVATLLSEFHDAPGGYQGPKLDDDLVILLQEKDTLLQTVNGSNDLHVGKIVGMEDEMREVFMKKTTNTVDDMKNDQREINRMRVLEIKSLEKETLEMIEEKEKLLNV